MFGIIPKLRPNISRTTRFTTWYVLILTLSKRLMIHTYIVVRSNREALISGRTDISCTPYRLLQLSREHCRMQSREVLSDPSCIGFPCMHYRTWPIEIPYLPRLTSTSTPRWSTAFANGILECKSIAILMRKSMLFGTAPTSTAIPSGSN